jgi:hypothetical protein
MFSDTEVKATNSADKLVSDANQFCMIYHCVGRQLTLFVSRRSLDMKNRIHIPDESFKQRGASRVIMVDHISRQRRSERKRAVSTPTTLTEQWRAERLQVISFYNC